METIHIFDEFQGSSFNKSLELRHQKRMALEPLVFDILKEKYGTILRNHFLHAKISPRSEKCVVIIERRIHPNLEFLLHNVAYFAPDWSICFICSDVNVAYCKQIAGPHKEKIAFFQMFEGSPSRDKARDEYNELLKSTEFYESLPWNHLWICQTDSYFRKEIPKNLLEYDFFAAPASWDTDLQVGGMSFRKRDSMIRLTKEFQEDIPGEDVYFSKGAKALGLNVPPFELAHTLIAESYMYDDPVGVHQWWTYFYIEPKYSTHIFSQLLTLDCV